MDSVSHWCKKGVAWRSRHDLIGGRRVARRKVLTPRNCHITRCNVGDHHAARLATIVSPRYSTWTAWLDMGKLPLKRTCLDVGNRYHCAHLCIKIARYYTAYRVCSDSL